MKEILRELCDYSVKSPHRNMWELKPEYRHYKKEENVETMDSSDDADADDENEGD